MKRIESARFLIWIFTIVIVLSICAHLVGFGYHIGSSYRQGQYGNQWVPFWGAFFGLIIDLQTSYLLFKCSKKQFVQRKYLWSFYCIWMFCMSIMIIIGDGIVSKLGERTGYNGLLAVWSGTWILTLFIMINIIWFEKIQQFWGANIFNEDSLPKLTNIDKLSLNSENLVMPCDCCQQNWLLKCIGWSSIVFVSFFSLLLSIEALYSANDGIHYQAFGQRISIEMELSNVSSVLQKSRLNMHILCKGSRNNGSTFIFESDSGSFSASFISFQNHLSMNGRRSCIYDRAGYGWSDVLPISTNSYQSVYYLHELLKQVSESAPYILVGHGHGGQLIQLYASLFPNDISGLVLIDSIPEFISALSLLNKPLNNNVTFADVQDVLTSKKTEIDLLRVTTPFGIHRWLSKSPDDFNPQDLIGFYNAAFRKSSYRHTQYFELIGKPHIIEILDNLSSEKSLNGFGWPKLSNMNIPVLGIISNETVGGFDRLCSSSIDKSCSSKSRLGRAFYDSIQIQLKTLSNNSTFIICDSPCSHTMIYSSKVQWLTKVLLEKFASI